jgi:aminopeptidase N
LVRSLIALPFLLLLAAAPVRAQGTPLELPADEIHRLTEEAAHEGGDLKGLLSTRPFAVAKDSTHSWDALHYQLDVKVNRTTFIQGTVTTTLAVRDPGTTTIDFDAVDFNITGVRVNGNARTVWTYDGVKLDVPICEGADCPPHAPGDQLTIAVDYNATPSLGFYHYARNDYSFVEPYDAKYWWPCWDEPFDKATLDVYATVPDTNQCFSNGLLVGTAPATPGFTTWHWQETHPVATYLVAVTVGKFWQLNQVAGTVPILNCAFPEDSTKAKAEWQNMPAMVNLYSALYAPYPFSKYGQITVDPFGAGGMEHQTMTTLRRQLLRGDRFYEYVYAHELTHQWWGDWVTCVDFRDIWLNEGFATYGEGAWVENQYSTAKYDSSIALWYSQSLNADASFRYAIYDPPSGYTFGTTIYKKGGSVLHMLRRVVGDAVFYAGLNLYGNRFAYGNATTRDFQKAMEDAWGQPLDWFFDQWIFAAGVPTYQWAWVANPANPPSPGQSDVTVTIKQVQNGSTLYRMPIPIRISRTARPDTFVTVTNDAVADQAFVIRVNGTPTGVAFDPKNNVLKRTVPVVGVGEPALSLVHLRLLVAPNPSRGPVQLRGAWQNADGSSAATEPAARARFRIYDASGRLVRDLGEGAMARQWDRTDRAGARVAPGLYFAECIAGTRRETRPVTVLP